MDSRLEYSGPERFWLWTLCAFGFLAVNTAFIYGLLFQPSAIIDAFKNPVAAAFIVEAVVLMGVFAYLLAKWKVISLHWTWFVVLSLLGSMAFALPIVLLWRRGTSTPVRRRA